ncbi:UNVERIFIED_CONTAM: hypothetical protein Slati_0502800 [Sesamum latifolium]|uniref:Uncharacterized protein n=1 Tax=Sesamum latifolium TaxID=2727402 RepID=A0AAW2Y0L8_9LAMI
MEDTPLIQFGRAERSGPQTIHNDALVITAVLANYEVGCIFIDSGSSTDILFGEAFDQIQLGDIFLEKVNTSLYRFAGEVVRGMISLPLTMGRGLPIKFPNPGGVGEVQDDPLQSRRCYVDTIRKGQKRNGDDAPDRAPPSKKGKAPEGENSEESETPAKVQPAEELLNIEIIPGNPDKTTYIAWTPQDLEGIDPQVITHHLNIDPNCKPVKQKKRYFGPEKDKIIQAEVNKLRAAGHIEEIQFPEWLSNVVLVPKLGGKWRMCIDF